MSSQMSLRCYEQLSVSKKIEPKEQQSTLKPEDKCQQLFIAHHYSYISNMLLRSLSNQERKLPLFKMLKGVCKLLMLNEMEIVVWGLINKRTQLGKDVQDLRKPVLYRFIDFLNLTEVEDIHLYKIVLLQLCLSAYFVRVEMRNDQDFEPYCKGQISQFMLYELFLQCYESRKSDFMKIKNGITLTKLNEAYIGLLQEKVVHYEGQVEGWEDDYNEVVDRILESAPPYAKTDEKESDQKHKQIKNQRQKKMTKKVQHQFNHTQVNEQEQKRKPQKVKKSIFKERKQHNQVENEMKASIRQPDENFFVFNCFRTNSNQEDIYKSFDNQQFMLNSFGSYRQSRRSSLLR